MKINFKENNSFLEEFYEVLDVLFKEREITKIIEIYNSYSFGDEGDFTRKLPDINEFRYLLLKKYPYYSSSEIDNIYFGIKQSIDDKSIFDIFFLLSNHCLCEEANELKVIYEKLLKWRMLSLKIDSEIFIAAYLVERDFKLNHIRNSYHWEDNIKSNNYYLQKILDKGIAENHYHLKGSAPHFNITWISLMNDVMNRNNSFKKSQIDKNSLGNDINKLEMKDMILIAANIRLWLYRELEGISQNNNLSIDKINIDKIKIFKIDLQNEIDKEKGFLNKNGFDYLSNEESYFTGEKRLLYLCMKKIKFDTSIKFEKQFYIYMMIKLKFRSEIIQLNDRVGFSNFQFYQNRKDIFLNTRIQRDKLITESILSSIRNQNIISLEARIVPKNDFNAIIKDIKYNDKIINRSLKEEVNNWYDGRNEEYCINNLSNHIDEKMYYVFHYPKFQDVNRNGILKNTKARNNDMRVGLKRSALSLAYVRERSGIANRILGIDGCGDELLCRPEVFGQSFRFLKSHYCKESLFINSKPSLRITYHVGEDFLDIGDGLRAVEEALIFLQMTNGDRIGHGLVLGIDIEEWYLGKSNRIILTKQIYLDNIAWMLNWVTKCNLEDKFEYYSFLKPIYRELVDELYGSEYRFDEETYYKSWLLRGDNPYIYVNGYYEDVNKIRYWDRCATVDFTNNNFRKNEQVTKLIMLYNFDDSVKKLGDEKISVLVDKRYVRLLSIIQKQLRQIISYKGIAIETNPSSNYLIGTFKRYDKHPITVFYNGNLNSSTDVRSKLITSINTDDQGVFNTYLEQEYNLVALSLEKLVDDNGDYIHDKPTLYKWIDEIRRMGLSQSFFRHIR